MTLLNKSAILAAADLKHQDIEVPQWGGKVRVRVMTGEERDEYRAFIASKGEGLPVGFYAATLVAFACIDEAGARLFTVEDVEKLHAKCAAAVDIPATLAMHLNGLGGKAVEEAVKNSESGQSGDSGSDSPKS